VGKEHGEEEEEDGVKDRTNTICCRRRIFIIIIIIIVAARSYLYTYTAGNVQTAGEKRSLLYSIKYNKRPTNGDGGGKNEK